MTPPAKEGIARRSVVVTGASAGVGRATALALAARKLNVVLIARDRDGLEAVARAVERRGGRAFPLTCDVADAEALQTAADRAAERFGGIDIWVNCAMVTVFARFDDIAAEEYRRVTEVTYLGQVHGTMAALRHMRPHDSGTIVQVGSALAYRGIPLQSAYCGAKHAIVGFTESLLAELLHEGSRIQIAMVHLPAVNTPQFAWARARMGAAPRPAGRPVAPAVAGRAVAEAALRPRREIYLGRMTPVTILGNAVMPGIGDRIAARAWERQLTPEPMPDREGNLFAPVTNVSREHGPFGNSARHHALRVSGRQARGGLILTFFAGIAATAALVARNRR